MYKEIRDENAEKMRDLAKTIKPTTATGYHVSERSFPCTPAQKAGLFLKSFFDPATHDRRLSTDDLVSELAGGQPGVSELNHRFKQSLARLYPGFPELQNMPRPRATVGDVVLRPTDYPDVNRGGQHWPEPAKALALPLFEGRQLNVSRSKLRLPYL